MPPIVPAQEATPATATTPRIGVDEIEMAAAIGMSVGWLRKDRRSKRLIPFFRLGDRVKYNPARVMEAMASLEEGGTRKRRNGGGA
jgi:hypothetical protein